MKTIARRYWKYKSGIEELLRVVEYLKRGKYKNIGAAIKHLRITLCIDEHFDRDFVSEDNNASDVSEMLDSVEEIGKNYKTISDFLSFIDEMTKKNENSDINKVRLMTIHKSKGLESKIVFVIGLNEGLLPHSRSEDIDEEKRLYYVAVTRAIDELYLSSVMNYCGRIVDESPFVTCLSNDEDLYKDGIVKKYSSKQR